MIKPRKSILDPTFAYRDAAHTDIRKTFARERQRIAATKAKPPQSNVEPLKRKA
jgi:hypothetical protein